MPVGSGNQYFGTAAEVTYVLVPNGILTAGGYPLYDLVRRQRLTALTSDDAPAYQSALSQFLTTSNAYGVTDNISEVSTFMVGSPPTGSLVPANSMMHMGHLTVPVNRLPLAQAPLLITTSKPLR